MKNSDIKPYIIWIIVFSALMLAVETLQLKIALQRDLEFQFYIIPILFGAAFGFLVAHVKILKKRIEYKSISDPLTNIHNRQWLGQHLKEQIEYYRRYQIELSIILFDIDQFKKINDIYGHHVGDEILIKVAQILKDSSRTTDAYCRWSGEEFLIMLPNTGLDGAKMKAEAIRKAIAEEVFSMGQVTCSFGVTEITAKEQQQHDLLKLADDARNEAKRSGRNRVCALA